MPLKVTVGPPVITVNHGSTFLVSEFDGSIADASDQGLYARDTRYVSCYQLYIDGQPWTVLNSGAIAYYASRIYLINPQVLTEHGDIAAGSLGLVLGRTIGEGLHEDIDIRNYSSKRVRFNLEILIRNDFADIFEVKSKELTRRGHIETEWAGDRQQLVSRYAHGDFHRALMISLEACDSKALYGNGRINFALDLAPGAAWHACCKYDIKEGDILRRAPDECTHACEDSGTAQSLAHWKQVTTQINHLERRVLPALPAIRRRYGGPASHRG